MQAFCKGVGEGLRFSFRRAEFTMDAGNPRNILLKIDGQPCTGWGPQVNSCFSVLAKPHYPQRCCRWHFTLQEVMEGHIMAVGITLNPQVGSR